MNQLFVRDLTVIDFSYFHAQRGIMGESWIADIELSGELDAQGMVFDFGHVKKEIKRIIDEEFDHRFVISKQTKNLDVSTKRGMTSLSWQNISGQYEHVSPQDAVVLLDVKTVNTQSVANYLEDILRDALPANVTDVKLTLREEQIEGAYYHYSHGLKKHEGNCQRIVHGHRSRIEIYENHKRNPDLEDYWSACFRNIYIGTREDITEALEIEGKNHLRFAYKSSQGRFSLVIPEKKTYLIDTDSTVEWIATHIAEKCLQRSPTNHYRVRAFEGVNKGAIAERGSPPKK